MPSPPVPPETFDDDFVPNDKTGAALKLLVFVFVVLLIAGVILFLILRPRFSDENRLRERAQRDIPDFGRLLESGNEQQLKKRSLKLQADMASQSLPIKIERLNQRIKIADRLSEISSAPSILEFAITTKIEALSLLQEAIVDFDLPNENVRVQLMELAIEGMNNENQEIRSMSHIALVVLYINEYQHDPSNPSRYAVCKRQLELSSNALINDSRYATKLFNIIKFLNGNKQNEQVLEMKLQIASALNDSSDPEIRRMGGVAIGTILDSKHNFKSLLNELEYADSSWLERAESFIRDIETIKGIPSQTFLKSVLLIESLIRIGKLEMAQDFLSRVEKVAAGLPDPGLQEFVNKALSNHKTRNSLIGKPYIIEGTDVFGAEVTPDAFADKVTTILFYSSQAPRSITFLSAIHELRYLYPKGARFVCIGIDQTDRENVIPMARRFDRMVWLNSNDAQPMIDNFPLTFTPYLIVVGKNGKVSRINVGLDFLRLAIEDELGD